MTPQAFSYPVVGPDGLIYVAPYGLTKSIDYMIRLDPKDYEVTKINLTVNNSKEKWQNGIVYRDKIYWLPYNENKILVFDTNDQSIEYIHIPKNGTGKYVQAHIHGGELIALPYGEHQPFDFVLHLDLVTHKVDFVELDFPNNDEKKWHTSHIVDGIIWGLPRGEDPYGKFNYRIKYDCNTREYEIIDCSSAWLDIKQQHFTNKKFTTMAKVGKKLFAPPYSENENFDTLMYFDGLDWHYENTGITGTSRKYFAHTVARNGKIYCPPAGHDEEWSEMLVIDSDTYKWKTIDLGIGKESKKYFAGVENTKGKIYYIPRGGCVCEPEDTWKTFGDLAEVLVVDTKDDSYYTIDVGDYFRDTTTIEKYNKCVIIDNVIYAFPYGQSGSFQTVLVFDTIQEKVIRTIDLNGV